MKAEIVKAVIVDLYRNGGERKPTWRKASRRVGIT